MAFNQGYWRAKKKQEPFLALPWTIKEGFYGGGAGSGKSDVLLVYGIVHKLHENPHFKQVFMRRTFPELRNEIVPRSREIYSKFGATLNRSEMCWTFPRLDQYGGQGMSNAGAMIFLGHCEDENDVHKYDSMEINLFTPDELTSITEYIYLYIGFTRVRTSDPTLPAIIRAAGMPGGIGHSWVKRRFVDPYKDGGKLIIGKGGNKRIYIFATLADNDAIDPGYAQSLEALPEAEKRAKKYGDWDAYKGQVFEEFRELQYPDEPENAIHVISPFEIPDWWPKIVIIDWGYAAMNYISYSAVSPNKRIYTYREQGWIKTKIEEWAPLAKEYIDKEQPRVIKICRSAGQDRGQEHTIQQQVSDALGHPVDLTTGNVGSRVAGKSLIHEYLRWKPKPVIKSNGNLVYNEEYSMWLMRNRGLDEYKSYLRSFNPAEIEENIPKWQIFNTCPMMIESLKSCSYDKPRKNKVAEDVAEFEGDDPYDNSRYLVDAAERYFQDAADEFKVIQRQQNLVEKLNNTQDFTAFYRNMRSSESSSDGPKMINRYSHRH